MTRLLALGGLLALAIAATVTVRAEDAEPSEDAKPAVERIAKIEHKPLDEISGLARSTRYDVWWVHNDSGDRARIFAIDGEGRVVYPSWLAEKYRGETASDDDAREPWPGIAIENAANVDWEELALIGDKLFIAEMGNNGNARRDLGVYVLNEPNPRAVDRARALKFLPVVYPDQEEFPAKQWQFDCEAIFGHEGKLYFLTKHRIDGIAMSIRRGTKLYRLDTEHTDRENVLTLIERHETIGPPTACSLSPDGRFLAVLGLVEVWVFERPKTGDAWLSGPGRMLKLPFAQTKQAEGICWDDAETLRIVNEQRDVFRVKLSALEPVPK